jgi:fructuronate reductase
VSAHAAALAMLPRVPRARPADAAIVHLGLGSFHRAHQAVYTARALDVEEGPWGIVGVAMRSRAVVDAMRAQDGLYSVLSLDRDAAEPLVVGVHTGVLVAAKQADEVVARIADARTRIVTITVTEAGYKPPAIPIALLARALERRLRDHGEPLAVVSCDNVRRSGERTRALVLELVDGAVREWAASSVAFPATMVDRIVPATADAHRAQAAQLLGVRDAVPVPAEPFSMWVLEDRFPGGRPRWEAAGVIFSDEVERYEVLKVRLLNATHSLIAYLGLLAGARFIAEAVAVPEIRDVAVRAMRDELLPTVEVPSGLDAQEYMRRVVARFENPATGHRTAQVASDGSLKLPERLGGAVRRHLAAGHVPRLLALAVAGFACCIEMDDVRDPVRGRGRDARSLAASLFPDEPSFVDAVVELHGALARGGWRAGIEAALS